MYLFIDTNIFLSFYHLTSEDLEELEKLVVLIDNKEITLFLPEQVIDETIRNRASKIYDSFASFRNTKFKFSYPAYCKDYKQYQEMRSSIKQAEKFHAEMVSLIEKDIKEYALKADILLNKLFDIALKIERTTDIVDLAQERISIGNPPGKKDSLGDAINWECLLHRCPEKVPLHLITDDSDFYSVLSTDKFNEFLQREWKNKKHSEIKFYRKLSDFFKDRFPNINLKTELEKDQLISELSSSHNFSETHSLIAKLSTYDEFTQKQAEDLVRAAVNNNQVNWILSDTDVYDFYKRIDKNNTVWLEEYYEEFDNLIKKAELSRNEDIAPF